MILQKVNSTSGRLRQTEGYKIYVCVRGTGMQIVLFVSYEPGQLALLIIRWHVVVKVGIHHTVPIIN